MTRSSPLADGDVAVLHHPADAGEQRVVNCYTYLFTRPDYRSSASWTRTPAIAQLCGTADVAPRAPSDTSGLIEQQRLFSRRAV